MNQNNRRVVVTGMGAVSPVGNDVQTSWENLISGVHGIGPITRFDTTEYKAKLAAEVKDFDARKYMEKAETLRSDLYAQYALASACQAVEESGVLGTVDPERFAVYFGTGIGGINTFSREYKKLLDRGPSRVSPYFIPMLIANMGAGMIAIRFNCQGPALPAVTACASGSNAIGEAVRAIRHGYADVVISGGAEASINECGVAGFVNMQALSVSEDPDAASLPFDKRRAGFIIGEGAAAVVLEEYEHAVKRGAKIYGEVCGYGSTCDAYHITAPLPDAAGGARAMKQALEEAGYTGEERLYINAHGTGTRNNDMSESNAIASLFSKNSQGIPPFSSTKPLTGHTLGAAGAIEAVLSLLMMQEGILFPNLNMTTPDPLLPAAPLKIKSTLPITHILSNSFGFGGNDTSLIFSSNSSHDTA